MSTLSTAGRWTRQPDDRYDTKHLLDDAYTPVPDEVRAAAEARVRKFVTEEASLAELFAMLGLVTP
ncbi:hypothetical protein SAMN05428970_1982 [Agromyces sp. CF514]|uniref:hypothetical protein n=1 Tax=Agromyces sp. CF514 TaxID=1881031 RepID=UPI0008E9A429|nr:hypothetical protein [Agromyces sp. CF514]SFR75869.1 hypothetical protein SAMN05428970_1982 [Agromyces sp. CF514]